jgi:hypothetical protein
MTRALSIYLAIEGLIIGLYYWKLQIWLGWKPVGPDAYPRSPDASWLYFSANDSYQWSSGLLMGVWLGGIASVLLCRREFSKPGTSTLHKALVIALFILPVITLIAGHMVEADTLCCVSPKAH